MTFRDDTDALRARIQQVERELAAMESELAEAREAVVVLPRLEQELERAKRRLSRRWSVAERRLLVLACVMVPATVGICLLTVFL